MQVADSFTLFAGGREAGRVLANSLARYRGRDLLVLGAPRGGVPVAEEVLRRVVDRLDLTPGPRPANRQPRPALDQAR